MRVTSPSLEALEVSVHLSRGNEMRFLNLVSDFALPSQKLQEKSLSTEPLATLLKDNESF